VFGLKGGEEQGRNGKQTIVTRKKKFLYTTVKVKINWFEVKKGRQGLAQVIGVRGSVNFASCRDTEFTV